MGVAMYSNSEVDERYPLGAKVNFVDSHATVSTGSTVRATGTVNGLSITDCRGCTFLRLWCERDNGRRPTTVIVPLENVLAI